MAPRTRNSATSTRTRASHARRSSGVRVLERLALEEEALAALAKGEKQKAFLYTPCPGNVIPAGPHSNAPAHPPLVFLARTTCRDRSKSIHIQCKLCGFRMFCWGTFWKQAFWSLDQVLRACPNALDGDGIPLAGRR